MADLKEKVQQLPHGPGCYLMKDSRGTVLYVGKAKDLRSRVSSYFVDSADLAPDKQRMVAQVADIDYLETADEVDAVLTEARLIKDIQPPYNVRLTDDKTFPYLEVTTRDDFPGVYLTRTPQPRSKLYGPFTDVKGLRGALPILQQVFRFRTCELPISADDPKLRYNRPCLLHPIGRCYGPCAGLISKDEYRRTIKRFQRFLEGKRQPLIRSMRKEMQTLSDAQRYEEAAHVRDQLQAIESLADRGLVDVHVQPEVFQRDTQKGLDALARVVGRTSVRTIEGVDIANLSGREMVGSLVTFIDGRPLKSGYRRFRIRTVEGQDDFASIAEVVSRRFRRLQDDGLPPPDVLLIDGGPGQLGAAMESLRAMGIDGVTVISLAKRAEEVYLPGRSEPVRLPRTNPGLQILQYVRDEAHRFAQHYHHILRRRSVLGDRAGRDIPKTRKRRGR
ncbi:MAG: excinuclease ABC subunit UvrC [Planctomycetes bacterium]|nr:excinuclease ABC subunit UvrC [Planctomycetota bacterium]